MLFTLAAVAHAPGATPQMQALIKQIMMAITYVRSQLTQLHQNALQLLHLSDDQPHQNVSLALLNSLEAQAVGVLAGTTDPASGHLQAGTNWIYQNIQRLASFNVTTYST